MRRKFTTKKNKTWDGDGILRVGKGYAILEDISGREMGRTAWDKPLLPESRLSIGGKDIEVDSLLPRKEYLSGRAHLNVLRPNPPTSPIIVPKPRPRSKLIVVPEKEFEPKQPVRSATFQTEASKARYKNPMLETSTVLAKHKNESTPRHDPFANGALIMKRPKQIPKDKQIVDVVVDPLLSKHLRDHQREGVKFLYECVMDIRDYGGEGAILADEMGLGKTLQTITLLWTLLKQNPIYEEQPVVKKALIVCPATLINNWKKEFRKWLGMERIGVFVFDDNKKRITDFTRGRTYSVLIISYEKLRTNIDELQKGHGIDIVIADEGHRLKKEQNKSGVAIRSLTTTKRIILSGTPIQNDLSEFFSMVTFVNPGILGSAKAFTKQFEVPIVKSRQPEASPDEIEKGQARSEELAETTSAFILRRTADILSKYLPTKTEYILLCRPTKTQAALYNRIIASATFQAALSGGSQLHLQLITLLKKVCNSPRLLTGGEGLAKDDDNSDLGLVQSILSEMPASFLRNNGASAKLRVLDNLLSVLRSTTDEKIVIVSNSTAILDLLGNLLVSNGLTFLRLDGSTPPKTRQDLVDAFNRTSASERFAFLLSAKAGGQGLNLIGASRLVLFDVDWNPATDAQAMARIHRDGQKRPCMIYRLLIAGGLDEKIWQRQVTKLGLADSIMDKKKGGGTSSFTHEELRDLFRLDVRERGCQTHELIACQCGGRGLPPVELEANTPPHEIIDSDDDDDEDDENDNKIQNKPMWRKASTIINIEAEQEEEEEKARSHHARQRRRRRRESSKEMQSLMEYTHIDTALLNPNVNDEEEEEDLSTLIHDEVLLQLLHGGGGTTNEGEEEHRIAFIFSKTSA